MKHLRVVILLFSWSTILLAEASDRKRALPKKLVPASFEQMQKDINAFVLNSPFSFEVFLAWFKTHITQISRFELRTHKDLPQLITNIVNLMHDKALNNNIIGYKNSINAYNAALEQANDRVNQAQELLAKKNAPQAQANRIKDDLIKLQKSRHEHTAALRMLQQIPFKQIRTLAKKVRSALSSAVLKKVANLKDLQKKLDKVRVREKTIRSFNEIDTLIKKLSSYTSNLIHESPESAKPFRSDTIQENAISALPAEPELSEEFLASFQADDFIQTMFKIVLPEEYEQEELTSSFLRQLQNTFALPDQEINIIRTALQQYPTLLTDNPNLLRELIVQSQQSPEGLDTNAIVDFLKSRNNKPLDAQDNNDIQSSTSAHKDLFENKAKVTSTDTASSDQKSAASTHELTANEQEFLDALNNATQQLTAFNNELNAKVRSLKNATNKTTQAYQWIKWVQSLTLTDLDNQFSALATQWNALTGTLENAVSSRIKESYSTAQTQYKKTQSKVAQIKESLQKTGLLAS